MGADIPHCQGAEYPVNNSMYQDIRVGVSRQTESIGNLDTAYNKGAALCKTMSIKSDAYPEQLFLPKKSNRLLQLRL
jgi:hypothetical protein